jgi:hypothetical protein
VQFWLILLTKRFSAIRHVLRFSEDLYRHSLIVLLGGCVTPHVIARNVSDEAIPRRLPRCVRNDTCVIASLRSQVLNT